MPDIIKKITAEATKIQNELIIAGVVLATIALIIVGIWFAASPTNGRGRVLGGVGTVLVACIVIGSAKLLATWAFGI